MKTVGAVIRAWDRHWYPHDMERMILELIMTVARPYYYIYSLYYVEYLWWVREDYW